MLVLSSFTIRAVVICALAIGAWVAIRERVEASSRGRRLTPADAPDLHAIVERLCIVADLPKPRDRARLAAHAEFVDRGHAAAAASGCT